MDLKSEDIKSRSYELFDELGEYLSSRNKIVELQHCLHKVQGKVGEPRHLSIMIPRESTNQILWNNETSITIDQFILFLEDRRIYPNTLNFLRDFRNSNNLDNLYRTLSNPINNQKFAELIELNLGLVHLTSQRFCNSYGFNKQIYKDLCSYGQIGLIRAIEIFNRSKGEFSTVAVLWISEHISRGIKSNELVVKVPHNRNKKDISPSLINFLELDADLGNNPGVSRGEHIEDPNYLQREEDHIDLFYKVSGFFQNSDSEIHKLEWEILNLRFGLDNFGERTTKEIIHLLDLRNSKGELVTEWAVNSRIKRILKRLLDHFET